MDFIDKRVKKHISYRIRIRRREASRDFMWYLWSRAKSPVFGKDKMTIFEHYFVEDKEASRRG